VDPFRFPFALLAFAGFVMVLPVWNYFVGAYAGGLPFEVAFLVRLVLPATATLFVASWVDGG